MDDIKNKVLDALSKPFCHFVSDVAKICNIKKDRAKEELKSLVKEGLVYEEDGYYYILKKGIITIKNKGFGFVSVEGEEDYYIAFGDTLGSYTGDEVLFYVLPKVGRQKLNSGVVIKILKHSNEYIYGRLVTKKTKKGEEYYITSYNKDFKIKAYVAKEDLGVAVDGSVVVGKITELKNGKAKAYIEKVVGHKDDPGVDISLIALEYGFESDFNDDVIKQTKKMPNEVNKEEYKDRRDFTDDFVITIDGDDSKDFDDAVNLVMLNNGNYQLSVHIADVSEYVKKDSHLDKEAYKRGTSVYLADRVIPMLPHKLSNGICSLNEGVDRLVLSCIMEIDNKGNLISYDITEGIIKSRHRMTYNKVNRMLEDNDKELINEYSDIYPMLLKMAELSKVIRDKRTKDGALDFDVPEYKITLDDKGKPIDFQLRKRGIGELLIEDFMLMANQTIAYHMNIAKLPCVYRVHENPDQEKLLNVFNFIKKLGYKVSNIKNEIRPKMIQQTMDNVKGSNEYYIINQMMLRAMMKAKYSEECLGHYGLAFQYYCHFTSPIRRYPDLMVHRLIKTLLLHPSDDFEDLYRYYLINLHEIAEVSSIQERKSVDCERDVDDMLMAEYMSNHIGEVYDGIINSITSFGMYVILPNGIEGLIHINNMKGYYMFNEREMSLTSYNMKYTLGDRVKIVVLNSSKKNRTIDFVLQSDYEGEAYGYNYTK